MYADSSQGFGGKYMSKKSNRLPDLFGSMVFDEETMKDKVTEIFAGLK